MCVLLEALESGNAERLKFLVSRHLNDIAHAEWPELFYLYCACERTNHHRGRSLVLNQLPAPGDPSVGTLSVRHFLFMELLRAQYLLERGQPTSAKECLANVAAMAAIIGERNVERIARSKVGTL